MRLVVQELLHPFLREKRAVCPCHLVSLPRGKARNLLAWLQIAAKLQTISHACRSTCTTGSLVPVPLNDVFGPCLMYRNFSDALKHPKIHPWTILANDLVLFVSGPLWDRAPGIGQVHSLNSSPPLSGGSGINDVCPLRVLSFSTGAALLWMSRRASRLTVVNLAAGQTQRKKP